MLVFDFIFHCLRTGRISSVSTVAFLGFLEPKYRVSIKSFPYYKHLLQENTVLGIHTYFFFKIYLKKFFLQHISTLQHVLLLLHGVRLIDYKFLSTCSPTCVQLLYQKRLLLLPSNL